jgi:hypothetical protein
MTLPAINKSYIIKRVLYYAFAFILIWSCGMNFKSGPCTPNLDVFAWFIFALLSLILVVKNFVQFAVSKDEKRIYSVSIHSIGLLLLWAWGNF